MNKFNKLIYIEAIIAIAVLAIAWVLYQFALKMEFPWSIYAMVPSVVLVSALAHKVVLGSVDVNDRNFTTRVMASSSIKMMGSLIILLVFGLLDRPGIYGLFAVFTVLYITFTTIEVVTTVQLLKKSKKAETQE